MSNTINSVNLSNSVSSNLMTIESLVRQARNAMAEDRMSYKDLTDMLLSLLDKTPAKTVWDMFIKQHQEDKKLDRLWANKISKKKLEDLFRKITALLNKLNRLEKTDPKTAEKLVMDLKKKLKAAASFEDTALILSDVESEAGKDPGSTSPIDSGESNSPAGLYC